MLRMQAESEFYAAGPATVKELSARRMHVVAQRSRHVLMIGDSGRCNSLAQLVATLVGSTKLLYAGPG